LRSSNATVIGGAPGILIASAAASLTSCTLSTNERYVRSAVFVCLSCRQRGAMTCVDALCAVLTLRFTC
jgi:hypothetical protein